MISAIELKKYVVGDGILGIIISKLCHEKKPYSIILLEVVKGLKVDFLLYYFVSLSSHLFEGGKL